MQSSISVALAATHHDPEGRLYNQTARMLPALQRAFNGLAVQCSDATTDQSVELLSSTGALVNREVSEQLNGLGRPRRAALALARKLDAPFLFFCDFDRVLHWAEYHYDELIRVCSQISRHDFTVLGRTARAFRSHPRIQRDTEAIVNHVYATISGHPWDVTAAARGMPRHTAEAILYGCPDESIGTDVAWPLFLQRSGVMLGYIETEGLEFETPDRYQDAIAAAGGLDNWLIQLDTNPSLWAQRLELARIEVESTLPYVESKIESKL